jgi:hypothetical protein
MPPSAHRQVGVAYAADLVASDRTQYHLFDRPGSSDLAQHDRLHTDLRWRDDDAVKGHLP